MAKCTLTVSSVMMAAMIAVLSGCDEKSTPAPPAPPPLPLTVGGSVTGLASSALILQLNKGNDLTVTAEGKFKFPKPLMKGSNYAVTIKTQPALPVRQTCSVSQGSGKITAAVSNVFVVCTTDSFAVGGTVSGLARKSKGLVLELNGGSEVEITKNGNFVFPNIRLPDGSDYKVTIKSTPARHNCGVKAVATATDSDTINIVTVTCFRT